MKVSFRKPFIVLVYQILRPTLAIIKRISKNYKLAHVCRHLFTYDELNILYYMFLCHQLVKQK